MSSPIEIHLRKDVDLKGALVVVGAPTLGFVGSITSRYLLQQFEMERVGGFHSDQFPPYTLVEEGRPMHLIRVHAMDTECGVGLDCKRLVVVSSEVMPGPHMVHPLARALVDWFDEIDAEMVLVPDGVMRDEDDEEDDGEGSLRGIGATKRSRNFLEDVDVQPLSEGLMVGLSAALLSNAEARECDLACLLTESSQDHPDARAAARIMEVLDKVLPAVSIDRKPLIEEAERIEEKVRHLRDRMMASQRAEQATQPPGLSMFH